jgi:hypothetical protein
MEIMMKYQFEVTASPESKFDFTAGYMFEEEDLTPVLHLHQVAIEHFGSLGPQALGDELVMRRYPAGVPDWTGETVFCLARFELVEGVPTVRMMAGPLIKQFSLRSLN